MLPARSRHRAQTGIASQQSLRITTHSCGSLQIAQGKSAGANGDGSTVIPGNWSCSEAAIGADCRGEPSISQLDYILIDNIILLIV